MVTNLERHLVVAAVGHSRVEERLVSDIQTQLDSVLHQMRMVSLAEAYPSVSLELAGDSVLDQNKDLVFEMLDAVQTYARESRNQVYGQVSSVQLRTAFYRRRPHRGLSAIRADDEP